MKKKSPTCETCRFWELTDEITTNGPCGECHHGPPQVVQTHEYLTETRSTREVRLSMFPQTRPFRWCGEWKAKP